MSIKTVFHLLLLSLLPGLSLTSCQKDPLPPEEYLIFGSVAGRCKGEACVEIFKLTRQDLFEDTLDGRPGNTSFYHGKFIRLSDSKHGMVSDLLLQFPERLLSEQHTVIGQPGVTDGGSFYIEYSFQGIRRFWIIDQVLTNVPREYHAFLMAVARNITLLQ